MVEIDGTPEVVVNAGVVPVPVDVVAAELTGIVVD